ncbi:MAG: HAD family phosphatase [Acidobacteriaceae bacterium]|jgi:putative hydrolase of the HAD superfamily
MAKIRATFWDCGGVLLTNGWDEHARERVAKHFGLNFDELEKRHYPANDLWERGKIDVHEYLRETVFYAPRAFSEDEFFAKMRDVSQVLYPEMIEFLGALRARGSRDNSTYMLSNESRELMEYRIPTFGLSGLFDAYLVSAYIALRKPEVAFFQCALDISQRQPDECVFIDDREENLEGARKLGIQGIRMISPEQVIADLRRLGITADRAA